MPKFIATDVLETAVQVSLHRSRQREQNLPTQERAIACEGIDYLDAHLFDLFRVDLEVLEVRFAHERIAEHFHQTIFGKLVGHLTLVQLIVGESDMAFHRGMRDSYRNTVVPIDTGHFLHQIAGCGEIGAPTGGRHREFAIATSGDTASDIGEDIADLVDVKIERGQSLHLSGLEGDRMATLDVVHVSRGVAGLRVTVFGEQVDGHLSRSGLDLGVHPAFKAAGGF